MKIESRLSLLKTGRVKQRLIQMDLKSLDAYSLERVEKGQLYEETNINNLENSSNWFILEFLSV